MASSRKRVRVRRDTRTGEQRSYDLAYHKGWRVGQEEKQETMEKEIERLNDAIGRWEEDYLYQVKKVMESEATVSELQTSISTLYDELHKARMAADGWRKQVRELTVGK